MTNQALHAGINSKTDSELKDKVLAARKAAGSLAQLPCAQKNKALHAIADEIEKYTNELLAANAKDAESARVKVTSGELSESLYSRLILDSAKLSAIVEGVRQVANLEDPVGGITLARELDRGLNLYRVTCPIGVIGVIFESRPDALPQIVSLCLKSGNAAILKGGKEAENSNKALFDCISRAAIKSGIPEHALVLLESREEIAAVLKLDKLIDLMIPRGSNALVQYVQDNTRIPVLGHAEGICHLYIDEEADLDKALKITMDSKVQYPAACNAVETLLVHEKIASLFIPTCVKSLLDKKVKVKASKDAKKFLTAELDAATGETTSEDWSTEYGDLIISLDTVKNIDQAIDHINLYGSAHTDGIITEDTAARQIFFDKVNSAGVFCNVSTRFADGFRYGFGAEVGISTSKLHPRGPVGLEGLVTYKYQLIGSGQIVADYIGPNAKQFTHKLLNS
jgi:glutamate-5-semialdehyde dehydrogenase